MMDKMLVRLLASVLIIVGIFLVVDGTFKVKKRDELKKIYKKTTGEYVGEESNGSDPDDIDYFVYKYWVDGKTYKIKTDYGSDVMPPLTRTIYYNPDNPKESIIGGVSAASSMRIAGIAFIVFPLFMILLSFDSIRRRMKNISARSSVRIFEIAQGIVFIILGIGVIYSITTGFENPLAFLSMGIFMFFPFIFLLAGVFLITHCKKSEEEMASDLEALQNEEIK